MSLLVALIFTLVANGSVVEAAGGLNPTASSHAKNYTKLLKSFISASSAPVG